MKYKVRIRDDRYFPRVEERIETIEFDGTVQELLGHAHILEILSNDKVEVEETQEEIKPVVKKK